MSAQMKLKGEDGKVEGKPHRPSKPLVDYMVANPAKSRAHLGLWFGVHPRTVDKWIQNKRIPVYIDEVLKKHNENLKLKDI